MESMETICKRMLKTLAKMLELGEEMQREERARQVLRTKLLEERENDTESESAEKTPEPISSNTDLKINLENSKVNFPIFSAHEESSSKWNHSNPSSHEEVMNFTSQEICNISGLDQHVMFGAPRSNYKESGSKPTCSGILIQKGSCGILNQTKPKSEEKVIQVTSQPNSDFAEPDLPSLIGDLRIDEKQLGYKSNHFEILTHQEESGVLNHINQSFNEGVMDFSNKCNLQLPYLEGHEFGECLVSDWRPEDFLIRLEDSKKTPRCIISHWIIDFQPISSIHEDFPFQAIQASNVIKSQQIFSKGNGRPRCLLGWSKIVPRHSSYGPKLSRLKTKNRRLRFNISIVFLLLLFSIILL